MPKFRSPLPLRDLFLLTLLIFVFAPLGSCERVYPVRTLPNWVQGVYIPMIQNQSTEPGLEETATRMIQEEFLADGRLRVVPKDHADVQIVAKIKDFRVRTENFDSDRIARTAEIMMTTELQLFDPFDAEKPFADLGTIVTNSLFADDARSVNYRIKPDATRDALNQLARQIVGRTISGFPADLKGLPEGVKVPEHRQPDTSRDRNLLQHVGGVFR